MEERIVVDVEVIRETISKFNQCKSELQNAYQQMATEVMALNSSWNGEASEAFIEKFGQLTANIKTSDGTIAQAVKGLQVAADVYTELENESTTAWDSATEANPFQG